MPTSAAPLVAAATRLAAGLLLGFLATRTTLVSPTTLMGREVAKAAVVTGSAANVGGRQLWADLDHRSEDDVSFGLPPYHTMDMFEVNSVITFPARVHDGFPGPKYMNYKQCVATPSHALAHGNRTPAHSSAPPSHRVPPSLQL